MYMTEKRASRKRSMPSGEQALETWTAVIDQINDGYRIVALQDGMPARCKRRECRATGMCQTSGTLAHDCGSRSSIDLFERVFTLIDYRSMLEIAKPGDEFVSNMGQIRRRFEFIVAEIVSREADFPQEYRARLTDYVNVHKHAQSRTIA
jgi:hypothetical protein